MRFALVLLEEHVIGATAISVDVGIGTPTQSSRGLLDSGHVQLDQGRFASIKHLKSGRALTQFDRRILAHSLDAFLKGELHTSPSVGRP